MTVKTRESFKLKLCIWILGISIAVFGLIFAAIYYYVTDEVRRDVHLTADGKVDYVLRALDEGLTNTEVSAENFMSIAASPLVSQNHDSIWALCEHFLDANPRIQGINIAYLSDDNGGRGFCPYLMRQKDGSYKRHDLGAIRDFRPEPWYANPLKTGESSWANPYRETNGTLITSYCTPMRNLQGEIFAILALDLGLDVVDETLQSLRPYPNSQLSLIDKRRLFIAHADKSYILEKSADELMEGRHFQLGSDLSRYYGDDETRGYGYIDADDERHYIFYAPEAKTGWTVILDVPQRDIAGGLAHLRNILLLVMLVGILLLVGVSLFVVDHLAKPLEQFAHVARGISHGDFSRPLPVVTEHNELYDLRQALAAMKGSLDTYIKQLEESTKSKATIESELNTARRIQMAMVPKIFPPYPDRKEIDIYANLIPAKAVGGDLYDYVLDGDDFYFCIGDVSGKGVPASLFMAITRSLFRNNVTHAKSPAAVANLLNNAIAQGNEENMFVTMIIGCCNLKTGKFSCCNCGHNVPVTNGAFISMDPPTVGTGTTVNFMSQLPTNLPIGIMEGFEYQEVSMQLSAPVKILLYTDGITEAENFRSELYGEERMLRTLSALSPGTSSEDTVKTLIADVQSHAGVAEQSDDITVLCISYIPAN